ncbi:MAG: hypothetical protein ABI382_09820 [Nakamurella sp.]
MRWEQLFADLDSRFDELADAEMMAELPDRQRSAAGSLTVVQRCIGAIGADVRVRVRSGALHSGELRGVGPDWILLGMTSPGEVLLSMVAVVTIDGLTATTGAPLSVVGSRIDLRLAMRGIARDRSPVVIGVMGAPDGMAGAGTELSGTIDRVGADFIEMAQHATWEPRRASSVRSMLLVPIGAVDSVRAMPRV